MISPTVGRVVWFYDEKAASSGDCQAAIVTHVRSDTCVNLAIFDHNGNSVVNPPTSVRLLQDGEERPTECCYCEWMPYQKGQAARTEQLEKDASKHNPA